MAVLRRGGMRPQASVEPAARRATRDLRRRRMSLTRKRAARLGHVQHTNRPYTLPEIGKPLADKAHRTGMAERVADPAVQNSLEVDRALSDSAEHLRGALEGHRGNAAQQHEAQPVSLRQTVPGLGTILSLVLWSEIPDMARFPSVQDGVSSCRLVTGAKASAGHRSGTAGTKLGNASRTWAFSEAAVLCRREHPAGQQDLARLAKHHGKGQALTVLAQTLARAIYSMLTRGVVVDLDQFLQRSRGAHASLRPHGGTMGSAW
jgi:transposase